MTSFFDKLNLRPNERRLVIAVAIVVFIIVNWIFIWPHFGDWSKLKARRAAAQRTQEQYKQEMDKMPENQRKFNELEKAGQTVNSEEQAIKLSSTIYNQAALSGVAVNNYVESRQTSVSTKPNQFFDEKGGTVSVTAEEKSLVDFLYNLGVGGSLIRVRSMTLVKDPPQQKLQGNLTMVASFARKAPPKAAPAAPAAAPARTNPPTMRPVTTGTKPASPFSRTSNAPVASKTNSLPKK
jgi:hypothetical protein